MYVPVFGRSWARFLSGTQVFSLPHVRVMLITVFTFHISLPRSNLTIFIHVVEPQAKIHLLGMLNHIVMQPTLTSFFSVLIYQKWINPLLRWNESDFEGIRKLYVEPKRVWVPDIHLYNK